MKPMYRKLSFLKKKKEFCLKIFAWLFLQILCKSVGWIYLFGWVSYSGLIRLIGRIGWMNHFDLLHHLYLIGSVSLILLVELDGWINFIGWISYIWLGRVSLSCSWARGAAGHWLLELPPEKLNGAWQQL